MKLFKTPKLENSNQKASSHKIVGVIDSSGSMSGYWKWVAEFWNQFIPADNAYTFAFDQDIHPVPGNRLQSNIKAHGGGRTDIPKAFDHLETKIKTFSSDTALTIIFISDGQDNNLDTLETRFSKLKGNTSKMYINFLCLGIESGFPTFLSMRIREKYHTGDATIPAIFLIEYASEKAFYNKFESMKPFFSSAKSVNLCPEVIQYPWEDPKESVYENTWVMTDSSMLEVEGQLFDLSKDLINLDGLGEIIKGWLQMLNLESLKPGNSVKTFAQKTLITIEQLFEQVKNEKGLDIIAVANESEVDFEKLTFLQRTLRNLVKYTLRRSVWYYEDIKNLAEGKSAKDVNEYDAAKKIGVGTIAGKHQQKAMALKGITPEEFKKIADAFAQVFSDIKHTTSLGNYKPLTNQVAAFAQKDFLEGLDTCHNQFDLTEAFPFTGIAVRLKRFNGFNENPWLTQIKYMPRSNNIIDLVSIVKILNANIGNYSIKLDDGTSEMVNGVLPLFRKEEEHLAPILSHKLHHLLMTFNITNNVELICEDAYLSLLANLLVFLLREQDSEWKTDLLDALVSTVKIVYYKDNNFISYREKLMKNPISTIATDPEQKKYGVFDLTKPLLHLYMLCVDNVLNKDAIKDILNAITYNYFFSIVKKADFPINIYLKCKVKSNISDKAADKVRHNFGKCYTMGDLRRKIYEAYEKILDCGAQYDFIWDVSELYKLGDKFMVDLIDKVSELFLKEQPKKEEYYTAIALAYISGTLEDMEKNSKKLGLDELSATIGSKISGSIKGNVKTLPAVTAAIDDLSKEFKEWFKQIHSEIVPMSYKELTKECVGKAGVNINALLYNSSSNLVRNACMAPKCPFYLKVIGRLSHHMDIWEAEIPEGFHLAVKHNCSLTVDEIFAKFSATAVARSDRIDDMGDHTHKNIDYYFGKNVDLIEGYDEDKFSKSKEEVLKYIDLVKQAYLRINQA